MKLNFNTYPNTLKYSDKIIIYAIKESLKFIKSTMNHQRLKDKKGFLSCKNKLKTIRQRSCRKLMITLLKVTKIRQES